MRNPKRIDVVLDELREYWVKNPDLRLGQIIANCVRAYDGRVNCDPFFIEDDIMLDILKKYNGKE